MKHEELASSEIEGDTQKAVCEARVSVGNAILLFFIYFFLKKNLSILDFMLNFFF